ncbi:hypothetical protein GCM10018966_004550 [Streptomyces yanii]
MTGRPAMRSPGRPPVRRDVERAFWKKIADGPTSEDAAIACGLSGPVGSRWFRERGGMPSIQLGPVSGRYLSFAEREEIAVLKAQNTGVREIARRLDPSTVSRELRRNAATRSGQLAYRASIAASATRFRSHGRARWSSGWSCGHRPSHPSASNSMRPYVPLWAARVPRSRATPCTYVVLEADCESLVSVVQRTLRS